VENDVAYRIALSLIMAVFIAHRGYYTRKFGSTPPGDAEAPAAPDSLAVAVVALLALIATVAYFVSPTLVDWAALPFPDPLRWSGLAVAAAGFALLQWSHAALGHNWSDEPRLVEGQTLTTNGPYRWVRHPIYTAFLIYLAAPLFIAANWAVGVPWIVMTALETRRRVLFEEALMRERFPEEYGPYVQRTGRLIPKLGAGASGKD